MKAVIFSILMVLWIAQNKLPGQDQPVSPSLLSADSVMHLKRQSEILVAENRFREASLILHRIADHYDKQKDLRMYFDYKNKALNCESEFGDKCSLLDSLFQLFLKYNESKINDTLLTNAMIISFVNNFSSSDCYLKKMRLTDSLWTFANINITLASQYKLAKLRIQLTKKMDILHELLFSYYKLLKIELPGLLKIKEEINLGNLYSEVKEYQLSNIVLQNTLCNSNIPESERAIIYNIIGNNYFYLNKLSLANYFYNQSLCIRQRFENDKNSLRVIYNNIANYYSYAGNIDSAKILYENALKISISEFGIDSRETAFELNNLGNLYFNIGGYDSANFFYQKSYNIKINNAHYSNPDVIHSLSNLGGTFSKRGEVKHAIYYFRQSIVENYLIAKKISLKNGLASPDDFSFSCKSLGKIYYGLYTEYKNSLYLDSAKFFFNKAITTNDSILLSSPIEVSKVLINSSNNKIIEDYLACYMAEGSFEKIKDTTLVLTLLDKCHNYVLFSKQIIEDKNLSNSFLTNDEFNYKSIDKEYNTIELLEQDRSTKLTDIYSLNKILYEKIINLIPRSNYLYFKDYLYDNPILSINNIRAQISDSTAILEFTILFNELYCLTISHNVLNLIKIGNISYLEQLFRECKTKLKKFELDYDEVYTLSKLLLTSIKKLGQSINKLIIINEDDLMTLPFDILLMKDPKTNHATNNFLISKYDISYSYSINHIVASNSQVERNKATFDFVGMAPVVNNLKGQLSLDTLKNNSLEILTISNLFTNSGMTSKPLNGAEANIENFYIYAGNTGILHIATHSSTNSFPFDSGLILCDPKNTGVGDNIIRYFDVLNLTRSPYLVVLASCSSYAGKWIDGEGMRNLGRAFSMRGSSYVISSLFRLDDEFSLHFMTIFYKNYIKSKDITHSLCKTKRFFLDTAQYSYPIYWSNFLLIEK